MIIHNLGAAGSPARPKASLLDAEKSIAPRGRFDRLRAVLVDHDRRNRAVDLRHLIASQILTGRVPHHPGNGRPAVRRHVEHLKLGPVAQIEAAQPMRLAELLHLARGQGHQLVDRQIELRAPDHSLAVRRDLQDHELLRRFGR